MLLRKILSIRKACLFEGSNAMIAELISFNLEIMNANLPRHQVLESSLTSTIHFNAVIYNIIFYNHFIMCNIVEYTTSYFIMCDLILQVVCF